MDRFEEELESIFPDHCKKLKPACEWIRDQREEMDAAIGVLRESKFDWKFENDVEPQSISYFLYLVPGGPSALINFYGIGLELICLEPGDIIIRSLAEMKENLLAVKVKLIDNLTTLALGGPAKDHHLFEWDPAECDFECEGYEVKLSIRFASFKAGYEHLLSRIENTEIECSSISWNVDVSKTEVKLVKYEDISRKDNNPSSYFTAHPRKTLHLS